MTLFLAVPQPSFAFSLHDFGSCLNPKVAASQVNTGNNHGVVGYSTVFSGTDSIYSLSDDNVLQCLCPENGAGIQTMWLKASGLSESEILSLQTQGWIAVPTGSVWGLAQDPYLAKNRDYSCIRGKGGGSTSSSSSSEQRANGIGGGVLGLATRGNWGIVYGLLIASFLSLASGLFLKRTSK